MPRDKSYVNFAEMWSEMGGFGGSGSFTIPNPFMPKRKKAAAKVDLSPGLARSKHVVSALKSLLKRDVHTLEFDSKKRLLIEVDVEVVDTLLVDEHTRIWNTIHAAVRKAESFKASVAAKDA